MMFEARGVWNSSRYFNQVDRINRGRLESFWQYFARRKPDAIAQIVTSDRMFQHDAGGAYAEAWALNFFLCETRRTQYCNYLAKVAARPPQEPYSGAQRLADFTDAFGTNLPLLDSQFVRFIQDLK